MDWSKLKFYLSIIIIILMLAPLTTATAQTPVSHAQAKKILILIGPQYGLPMLDAIVPALVNTLQDGGVSLDDIFLEYLDLHRNPGPQYRTNLLALLQNKLADQQVGLIITINQGAVDFLAREGQDLFPAAPMLIPIFEKEPAWTGEPRQLITLLSRQDAAGTIRHAFNLFPGTQRVSIIMGKDDQRAPFDDVLYQALAELPYELEIEDTATLSYEEMLQHIASLSGNTIAFYGSYFEDITGRTFVPAEVAAQVAAAANVPVFALRDMHILQGLAGGSVTITSELGKQAGEISLDYLQGNIQLQQQTTTYEVPNHPLFNWQQLKEWGGDIRKLPADTVFFNRSPSLWEQHRTALISAGIVFILLIMLIFALMFYNRRLKKSEQELQGHRVRLNELLAERSAQLEAIAEARKQLEAKNKELEQLVYVASHDLRSPLVNVDGFSRELEYSLREIGGLLGGGRDHTELEKTLQAEFPDMEKALQRIRASTRQMDSLLKSLLKLSRVGRAALQIGPVDMNKLLRELSSSLAYRIEEGGIELIVEDLPSCRGDAQQLTQLFANLLDNAVKYLDPDRPGKIKVSGAVKANRSLYRIEDNGIGIAENHQENIFELFHRLNPGDSEGEGLGLTIARQVLSRLGGEIAVASKPGAGSRFTVSLPCAAGQTHE